MHHNFNKWAFLACVSLQIVACAQSGPAKPSSPVSDEQRITQASEALVPTGPWPAGDQRGMANTLGAGTLMRCGYYLNQPGAHVYELSYERSNTMPMSPFGKRLVVEYAPSTSLPGTRHVFNGEHVDGEPGQQGTQMDALGHFAFYDRAWDGNGAPPLESAHYYAGYTQADVKPTPNSPLLKLGIEQAPPIITSAVLLDAKSTVGHGASLAPGQLVTAADIKTMLDQQGLGWRGILPGDVVYIYTGWGDGWHDPDQEKVYYTKGPGLSIDATEYLASRSIVLIALDNPFTDPVAEGQLAREHAPPQGMDQGLPFFVHHYNLAVAGIHQIQNAALGELARDHVWTSCTIVLPLRERGGAGSPVRPIAIGIPSQVAR